MVNEIKPQTENMQEIYEIPLQEALPRINETKRFFRVFFSRSVVKFGALVIIILILAAIFAPFIAPYDPYEPRVTNVLQPPGNGHLLGTDALGRDTLSRIIYGSRLALLIGVVTVLIASIIGSIIGVIAGYTGGWVQTIIMRLTDAMMAFPPILLALVVAALMGSGVRGVMIAVSFSLIPGYIRLMFGQVLSAKENEYVMAADAVGVSKMKIMFRHILPNCLSPLIVQVTMVMGLAILTEATLSFLGVGIMPPAAAWGAMVQDGNRYLIIRPVLSLAPGFAIMIVVFSFNMVGDGLRDALDPRLRGTL